MNRTELLTKIRDIIWDIEPATTEEAYIDWEDATKAAEKILTVLDEEGALNV